MRVPIHIATKALLLKKIRFSLHYYTVLTAVRDSNPVWFAYYQEVLVNDDGPAGKPKNATKRFCTSVGSFGISRDFCRIREPTWLSGEFSPKERKEERGLVVWVFIFLNIHIHCGLPGPNWLRTVHADYALYMLTKRCHTCMSWAEAGLWVHCTLHMLVDCRLRMINNQGIGDLLVECRWLAGGLQTH